jgi:cytochrome c-type biogenesis protein CcsB
MFGIESLTLNLAIILLVVSVVVGVIALVVRGPQTNIKVSRRSVNPAIDTGAVILMALSLVVLTISVIARWIQTGHGPFSSMYEFAVGFSWGVIVIGLIFQWRYKASFLKIVSMIIAIALLLFAASQPSRAIPLVPALQQSYLLTAHVASAVIAYGTFTSGFAAAVLYLIQKRKNFSWMPGVDQLDDMSYRAVVVGFPFLTLLIILGALWANIAWGKYWSWDPKETASLVTWLFYVAYMHARLIRGWKDSRAAILLIIGFAAVLFTFFGNFIFSGLHAYG